jgi:hypothetical protein
MRASILGQQPKQLVVKDHPGDHRLQCDRVLITQSYIVKLLLPHQMWADFMMLRPVSASQNPLPGRVSGKF